MVIVSPHSNKTLTKTASIVGPEFEIDREGIRLMNCKSSTNSILWVLMLCECGFNY